MPMRLCDSVYPKCGGGIISLLRCYEISLQAVAELPFSKEQGHKPGSR